MYFLFFFNFRIISVITILPKKGQNTENTTFLHVKMTAVRRLRFLESFSTGKMILKQSKKGVHPCARKLENQLEHATPR